MSVGKWITYALQITKTHRAIWNQPELLLFSIDHWKIGISYKVSIWVIEAHLHSMMWSKKF